MANFFSARFWKALYFKAMGGQETAVDPNAMSGSFAGTSAFSGELGTSAPFVIQPIGSGHRRYYHTSAAALKIGRLSASFAGSSTFGGKLEAAEPTLDEQLASLARLARRILRLEGYKPPTKLAEPKPDVEALALAVKAANDAELAARIQAAMDQDEEDIWLLALAA
jgi:hypothetical protein